MNVPDLEVARAVAGKAKTSAYIKGILAGTILPEEIMKVKVTVTDDAGVDHVFMDDEASIPPPPPPPPIVAKDWGLTLPVGGGFSPALAMGYKVGSFNWTLHIDEKGVPTIAAKLPPWPKLGG